ncbi:MAG: aminotransferase class V-fold PLP-dependent enzyme [Chromatiaceae bacterium]|nr:aminotransferase class V-fold PLP-dependent enzyme [Gammaproteobacteria bacterium]MCB1871661.1 aminotransferase class V-fold PLP-dependent enzyme [Gammaproteobacteria bacterium]MCP5445562.1 aminotransferase class V-fold PLP-dependent enzyme [Chromatiaceae bacterium]
MKSEFNLDDSIIYLNHAAVAPWPATTAEAVKVFADENAVHGAANYPQWMQIETQLRQRLAWLINAPATEDIAILKSTSEALSVVAYGLDWKPGDNVVIFQQEFPSNRLVWESLKSRGVETRLVDLWAGEHPEQHLLEACNEHTRLVSVSSVQYATGFKTDLETVGRFCRRESILFCVDAIQSLGAIPFDVQQIQADFVMADGHKWMLGPEGTALFYSRREIRDQISLNQFGWHMVEARGDFEQESWQPSTSGTRFECGSPNMLGIHALNASLALIEQTGIHEIHRRVIENTKYIIELLNQHRNRISLISVPDGERLSGIVTFRMNGSKQQDVYHALMQQGVICASRGGGIRFSPHFYTSREKIEKAIGIALKI